MNNDDDKYTYLSKLMINLFINYKNEHLLTINLSINDDKCKDCKVYVHVFTMSIRRSFSYIYIYLRLSMSINFCWLESTAIQELFRDFWCSRRQVIDSRNWIQEVLLGSNMIQPDPTWSNMIQPSLKNLLSVGQLFRNMSTVGNRRWLKRKKSGGLALVDQQKLGHSSVTPW